MPRPRSTKIKPCRTWPLPSCAPLRAALCSALAPLPAPWRVALPVLDQGGSTDCMHIQPLLALPASPHKEQPAPPCVQGSLLWKGHLWTWTLDSLALLRLHPALHAVPERSLYALPEALRLAVLDILLEPLCVKLGEMLGSPVMPGDCFLIDKPFLQEHAAHSVTLELLLDAGTAMQERAVLHLTPPHQEAVAALKTALRTHVQGPLQWQHVPLVVSVVTGHVRLSLEDMRKLAPGHVILPDTCAGAGDLVQLCLPTKNAAYAHAIPCTLHQRTLTVNGPCTAFLPMEFPMSDTVDLPIAADADTAVMAGEAPSASAATEHLATDALGVDVLFELERRCMTLEELSQLAPGSVLTLTAEVTAPVTLRVQGKAVGTGRLVDVDGLMGIQIVSVG